MKKLKSENAEPADVFCSTESERPVDAFGSTNPSPEECKDFVFEKDCNGVETRENQSAVPLGCDKSEIDLLQIDDMSYDNSDTLVSFQFQEGKNNFEDNNHSSSVSAAVASLDSVSSESSDDLKIKHTETSVNSQLYDTLFKALYRGTDNSENEASEISQMAKENFVELYNEFLIKQTSDKTMQLHRTPIQVNNVQPYNLVEMALSIDFHNDVAYGIVESEQEYRSIIVLEHQSTYNKNMCFRELIYYVKMLIKYMNDRGMDLTKSSKCQLPKPEFYVIEFNTKTECNSNDPNSYYKRSIETYEGDFLTIKVVYFTIYCKSLFALVDEGKCVFDSLLQCCAVFTIKTKLYCKQYMDTFCDSNLIGVELPETPKMFVKALRKTVDVKIASYRNPDKSDKKYKGLLKLQKDMKGFDKGETLVRGLLACTSKAERLGVKLSTLSGYDIYQEFQKYFTDMEKKININAIDKTVKDFEKFLNNDSENLVLQRFNKILRKLGGASAMSNFVEYDDDDDEIRLCDIPFIKEKFAEKDAKIIAANAERDAALAELKQLKKMLASKGLVL